MTTTRTIDCTAPYDPHHDPHHDRLQPAIDALQRGELVVFPTETVYGLGANARDAAAVARIFAAKGRPATDPVIVHIPDADALPTVADPAYIPPSAYLLAERFWPGPLTLVLRRQAWVPDRVTAGGNTVGVRVPAHPVARALLQQSALPLAAPSANRFARPSPTTADHARRELEGRVAFVLDAGPTTVGIESTVLDLSGAVPHLLRPGGVTLEDLRALLPAVQHTPRELHETETAPGPGMMLRHYAPHTPLTLLEGPPVAVVHWLHAELDAAVLRGQAVGVIAPDVVALQLDRPGRHILGLGPDLAAMARTLFAALRDADTLQLDALYAVSPAVQGLGLAIRDRLYRAAEGRVLRI